MHQSMDWHGNGNVKTAHGQGLDDHAPMGTGNKLSIEHVFVQDINHIQVYPCSQLFFHQVR